MSEMRLMTTYFSLYDGENDWEKILLAANNLAHPDLRVTTGKGDLNREQWMSSIEKFVKSGLTCDMLKFEAVPGKGDLNREQWMSSIEKFVKGGLTCDMLKFEAVPGGVKYEVRVHFPDGSTQTNASMGEFKDGKLIHVQPSEPSSYNKMFDGPIEQKTDVAVQQ
eukprot:CAMPEP_0197465622 /NCGR_PEP_ID=MMETSP1175-20131217/64627_1 /TAXON_ID=1003142 /ORGANISM="Triceratium dubium, Strain CCMP147" /LENGTH=164 /DNA_ID=CAMNT_0043001641 /DNA_START=279 /DNA_END=773 /DNA_ORIENTATION=+